MTEGPVHFELLDALAAPLNIILITSQDEYSKRQKFYGADFTQNIRHKFMFLILTKTRAQNDIFRKMSTIFYVRTIVWANNKKSGFTCMTGYDNLFARYTLASLSACKYATLMCALDDLYYLTYPGTRYIHFYIVVALKCNSTAVRTPFEVSAMSTGSDDRRFDLLSRWSLIAPQPVECLAFTVLTTVDVSALLQAFLPETWGLIFMSAAFVAVIRSTMFREPSLRILGQTLKNIITVGNIDSTGKSYPRMMMACASLALSFFVGLLYANNLMSSFLNPTTGFPSQHYFFCWMDRVCESNRHLEETLEFLPVCNFPPLLRVKIRKPLARFHYDENKGLGELRRSSANLMTFPDKKKTKVDQLPLTMTQRSNVLERAFQHGVISYKRIETFEFINVAAIQSHAEPTAQSIKTYSTRMERIYGKKPNHRLLTYESTTGELNMSSFLKLQPLFGFCFLSILAVWGFERYYPRRSSMIQWLFS